MTDVRRFLVLQLFNKIWNCVNRVILVIKISWENSPTYFNLFHYQQFKKYLLHRQHYSEIGMLIKSVCAMLSNCSNSMSLLL